MSRIAQFLIGLLIGLVSQVAALVNINRVSFHSETGEEFVHKRRVLGGWILVLLSYPVLRFRRVPVAVLFHYQWSRRERTIRSLTRNEEVLVGRELVFQKISGETLVSLLSADQPFSEKQALLSAASEALFEFHKHEVNVAGAGCHRISHGDASITNVLYDSKTGEAVWFDFDLAHDFQWDAIERHADDLRALLFTAAQFFEESLIEEWVQSQRAAYPNDEVWAVLAKQLSSHWFLFDVFHQSQVKRARKYREVSNEELKRVDAALLFAIKN